MSRRPLADRGYTPDDPFAALLAADEVAVPRPGFKETLRSDLMSRPPVAAGPTPMRRIRDLPAPLLGAAVVVLLLGALGRADARGRRIVVCKQGVEPDERAADTAPTALDSVAPEGGSTPAAPGDEGGRSPAASRADQPWDEPGSEDDGERAPASAAGESDGPAASADEGDGESGSLDASGEPAAAGAAGARPTSTAATDPDGSGAAGQPARTALPQATSEPEKPRPEPTSTRVEPAATSEPPTDEPTDAPTDEPTEDPGGFPPPPTAAPTGKPWPTETPPAEPPGPSP